MTERRRTVSRVGTARALVLLAAALLIAVGALVCFVVLAFGPAILDRPGHGTAIVLAGLAFFLAVLVSAIAAGLLATRAPTVPAVVVRGFGTLLAGVVVGLGALLVLISSTA